MMGEKRVRIRFKNMAFMQKVLERALAKGKEAKNPEIAFDLHTQTGLVSMHGEPDCLIEIIVEEIEE